MTSGYAERPAAAGSQRGAALASGGRLGTARQVILELKKGRRKHLWLICAVMLGALLLWFGYQSARQIEVTGDYRVLLFSLPTVNAVFLPLLSAVVASHICDVENRANMWKQLLTLERSDDLFCAKWLTCALVLAAVVTVEVAAASGIGRLLGFAPIPAGESFVLWVSTLSVCLFVATVVECLCLFIANQFVPLVVGVALSFLGLFSMYLPPVVAALVPSSYFGLMSTVTMSYDAATEVITWGSVAWPVGYFALIVVLTVVAFAWSLRAFSRKEL